MYFENLTWQCDRNFFKENNIHPAEFLRAAWAYEDETSKLIDWVVARKSS